mmetsp:Transcript_11254/g.17964  ORF Transcript_11254/g.17964 Transcript_11254/m.17964 type:complete len:129 (+) Transcript_11254:674-1060(+)
MLADAIHVAAILIGKIMMVGNLGGRGGEIKRLDKIFYKAIRIQGLVVGHKQGFEDMLKTMETHRIRPVVGKVFDLAHSKEAFSYMASDKSRFGKVVIRVSTPPSKCLSSSRPSPSLPAARDVTLSSKL